VCVCVCAYISGNIEQGGGGSRLPLQRKCIAWEGGQVELTPCVCTTHPTTFGHVWVDSIAFFCLPLDSEINSHDLLVGLFAYVSTSCNICNHLSNLHS
jgi:hypothetical protein